LKSPAILAEELSQSALSILSEREPRRTVLRRRREIKKKDKGSKMKEGNTKTHDRMKINTNSMHVSVRI